MDKLVSELAALGDVGSLDGTGVSVPIFPLYEPVTGGEWQRNDGYDDIQVKVWQDREIQRCRESLIYFAEHYVFTVNEHLEQSASPTIELIPSGVSAVTGLPWMHVRAVLSALDPPQNIVIEKSRDMMLSWLVMTAVAHDVMFRATWPVMTLSRLEQLVDDGGEASTRDSLHGKVRFIYEHLPPFLQEYAPLQFKYLAIRNPVMDSHVTGFSATPSAGRGPKWKRAVLDEFAHVPHSTQVMYSVGPACPIGQVHVSTPNGKANAFYDLRQRAKSVYPDVEPGAAEATYKRLTVHWTQHPERDQAWYEAKKSEMTAEAIAQELDLNYVRSLGGRIYSAFMHEKHVAGGALCPLKSVEYDGRRALIIACDWNYDPLLWEIAQVHAESPHYRVIGEICRRSAIVDDVVREFEIRYGAQSRIEALFAEHAEWESEYGRRGIALAGPNGHQQDVWIFGDATEEKSTVHNRVKTYQALKAALRDFGFRVTLKVPPSNPPRQLRFEIVNHALSKDAVVLAPECEQLRKDFESGVWNGQRTDMDQTTEDDDGSGLTRSHASSALGYWLAVVHRHVQTTATTRAQARVAATYLPEYVRGW